MELIKALHTGTPGALSKAIDEMINKFETGSSIKNYFDFAESFVISTLMDHILKDEKPPIVLNEKEGLAYLAAHQMTAIGKHRYNRSKLDDLNVFISSFGRRKQKVLSIDKIMELLDYVDQLGYMKWINIPEKKRRLTVVRIPYLHSTFNSLFDANANIIMCSPKHKDREGTLEEIFLHEVGHSFHSNISGGTLEIPDSFMPFLNIWFNYEIFIKEDRTDEQKTIILQDIFADCFTVAVCAQNKELRRLNSFCSVFEKKFIEILIYYFNEVSKESLEIISDRKAFWNKGRKDFFENVMSAK